LKEDVLVKSDASRVAIDLDTQIHGDAIATVKNDITLVNKQRKQFAPVAELSRVGNLLSTLELRLKFSTVSS